MPPTFGCFFRLLGTVRFGGLVAFIEIVTLIVIGGMWGMRGVGVGWGMGVGCGREGGGTKDMGEGYLFLCMLLLRN